MELGTFTGATATTLIICRKKLNRSTGEMKGVFVASGESWESAIVRTSTNQHTELGEMFKRKWDTYKYNFFDVAEAVCSSFNF